MLVWSSLPALRDGARFEIRRFVLWRSARSDWIACGIVVDIIPRCEIFKRTETGWSPFVYNKTNKRTAAMTCPKCGHAFHLGNHTISKDGVVSPSVVCPWKCGYHTMVKLDRWEPEEIPH